MNKQRIIRNALIMGWGQLATFGMSLLFVMLISRYLGPTRFGELALAKSVVVVAWLGAKLGMETMITRSVARTPERAGALVSAAIITRTALAIPVLAAIYLYTQIAHLNAETSWAVYMYGAAEVFWSPQLLMVATFQGRERMSLSTIWNVGHNVIGIGLALIIMWRHGGVVALAAADLPVAILLLGVTLRWMRQFGRLTWQVTRRDLREVMVGGLAFWANDVFFNIGLYLDAIILAALAGTAAVGIYRPATQMLGSAMFLTGIIGPATLPMLSRLGIDGSADFKRAGGKTLSVFIVCGVPLTIGLITFAGPLVLTFFGPAYQPSVPVLMAISLCIPPMFLNFQFSQLLTASDRQWLWTVALGGTCVVNPLFNVALIPLAHHYWHNAALGAALAWVATELAEVIYGTIILRDVVLDRSVGRALFGALTAGAAQCAMLWITAALWPPLAEALGMAAYGAVALAVQALPREDVRLLFETVLFRVRGRRADPQAAVTSS